MRDNHTRKYNRIMKLAPLFKSVQYETLVDRYGKKY